MAVDLRQLTSWEELFEKYTVPEIRQLRETLSVKAGSKKEELRSLIGERYKDLLHTADAITAMDGIGSKEDNALSELCNIQRHRLWSTSVSNALKFEFSEPKKQALQNRAVRQCLKQSILYLRVQLSEPENFTSIARTFYLADTLLQHADNSAVFVRHLNTLRRRFERLLHFELIEGDELQKSKSLDLLTAYTIFNRLSPDAVLESLFERRKLYIESVVKRHELLQALKLVSATFFLSEQAYGRNQLYRVVTQQFEVYSLLDAPEFAGRVELHLEQYRPWLPNSVQQERSIPDDYSQSARSTESARAHFVQKQRTFGQECVAIIASHLDSIFANLTSLDDLVSIYRSVLEQMRENKVMRTLQGPDNSGLFASLIRLKWAERFESILTNSINLLTDLEPKISAAHGRISGGGVADTSSPDSSFNLFSEDSEFASINLSDKDALDKVFATLDDFSIGRIDTVRDIASEYAEWYESVLRATEQVAEAKRLESSVSTMYQEDDYDVDDDDDDDWTGREKDAIHETCAAFATLLKQTVTNTYTSICKSISSLDSTGISANVLQIRAILVLDYYVGLLNVEMSPTETELESAYTRLADALPFGHFDINYSDLEPVKGLWKHVQESQVPSAPSLPFLGNLSQFVESVTSNIGQDDLIWGHKRGLQIIKSKILKVVTEKLESQVDEVKACGKTDSLLQLYTDLHYVTLLLNNESSIEKLELDTLELSKPARDTLDSSVRDFVTKTRTLNAPLAF